MNVAALVLIAALASIPITGDARSAAVRREFVREHHRPAADRRRDQPGAADRQWANWCGSPAAVRMDVLKMTLLRFHFINLHLNPRAPWPSEVAARKRYRMLRLRRVQ